MRGNQKQKVFQDENDHSLYLKLLRKFKQRYKLRIYAYCLMPNHIHMVADAKNRSDLSSFMHDLNRTYTLYFNAKYKQVGHLWQGRFKSKVIGKDKYLIDCLNYIEFNPVRAKLSQNAIDYPWSSYPARTQAIEDRITDDLNPD
jgi:putative transposase